MHPIDPSYSHVHSHNVSQPADHTTPQAPIQTPQDQPANAIQHHGGGGGGGHKGKIDGDAQVVQSKPHKSLRSQFALMNNNNLVSTLQRKKTLEAELKRVSEENKKIEEEKKRNKDSQSSSKEKEDKEKNSPQSNKNAKENPPKK